MLKFDRRVSGCPTARLACLMAVVGVAAGASAQPAGEGTGTELERTPGSPVRSGQGLEGQPSLIFEAKAWTEYVFDAEVDDSSGGSSGDLSITRAGGQLGVSGAISDAWRWNVKAQVEASWYNFDDFSLVPGTTDPLNDVYELTLTPSLLYQASPTWAFLGGGIIQFAGESGADVGESATFGGFFGSRWQVSPTFALQLGFAVKTRIEDNVGFLPALGFDWKVSEKVRLASEGAGLKLSAEVNEQWVAFINAGWAVREYRLEDDSSNPLLSEGVFRDQRFTIGAGVEWKPTPKASITLTGGVVAWSEIQFDDENGVELAEEELDPTGYVGLTGKIVF